MLACGARAFGPRAYENANPLQRTGSLGAWRHGLPRQGLSDNPRRRPEVGPAASGACARRAGLRPSYWAHSGVCPVRYECVHGVAGQTGIVRQVLERFVLGDVVGAGLPAVSSGGARWVQQRSGRHRFGSRTEFRFGRVLFRQGRRRLSGQHGDECAGGPTVCAIGQMRDLIQPPVPRLFFVLRALRGIHSSLAVRWFSSPTRPDSTTLTARAVRELTSILRIADFT